MKHWLWRQPRWVHRLILWLTGYRLKAAMLTRDDGQRVTQLEWVRRP